MNNNFLKKIFSFEKFASNFISFLKHFMVIGFKDNDKKIDNTARKLAQLVEND
jgi:hypothetical protein